MPEGSESHDVPRVLRGEESAPAGAEHARVPPLGVLFVHGIGKQQPGETLNNFAAPLYHWFKSWLGEDRVHLVLTDLQGDSDRPAHTWLRLRPTLDQEHRSCLLAESHWAGSFPTPTFKEVARWTIRILPWTTSTQLAIKGRSFVEIDAGRILSYPRVVSEFLTYLGAFFISLLAQFVTLVLLLFAGLSFGSVRNYFVSLQLRVASTVGDSYVLLSTPLKENAIISRFLRDLNWLKSQGCKQIAVVAHSQGAAVAFRGLVAAADGATGRIDDMQDSAPADQAQIGDVKLFFSFGSGLAKLHDIEESKFSDRSLLALGWVASISITVATVLVPWSSYRVFTDTTYYDQPHWSGLATTLSFVLAIGTATFISLHSSDARKELVRRRLEFRWVDVFASRDPVPSGPLLHREFDPLEGLPHSLRIRLHVVKKRRDRWPEPEMVFNRHSVWSDHSSYFENTDEFVTLLARELAPLVPIALEVSESDSRALAVAPAQRRWRVRWLVAARMVVVASALLTIWQLSRSQRLENLAADIVATGRGVWEWMVGPLENQLLLAASDRLAGEPLFAAFGIGLLHYLWYRVVLTTWRTLDRRATTRFFRREATDVKLLPSVVLAVLAILPALAVYLAAGSYSRVSARLASEFIDQLALAVALATLLSALNGMSLAKTTQSLALLWAKRSKRRNLEANELLVFFLAAIGTAVILLPVAIWWSLTLMPDLVEDPTDWAAILWTTVVFSLAAPVAVTTIALWLGRVARVGVSRPSRFQRPRQALFEWLVERREKPLSGDKAAPIAFGAGIFSVLMSFVLFLDWWRSPLSVLLYLAILVVGLLTGLHARFERSSNWSRRVGILGLWLLAGSVIVPNILSTYFQDLS